ncbi:YidE/YbjL duplication [Treponema sp.]|uniref:aspartate-alanine antiporter-like transporter n=1 Tax=Treponema sp. TaxID=166 RepID=UPI003F0AC73C
MITYFAGLCSSALSVIFIIFIIGVLGFMLGGINVKGISLGTAGVLIVAIIYGIAIHYVPEFYVADRKIVLWGSSIKANFSLISNIGTALFVTAVGLIAGPKFFRTFNRKSIAYLLLGVIIIAIGGITAVICVKCDGNLSPEMAAGLLTGGLTSTPGFSAAKEVPNVDQDAVSAGYGIAYLYGVLGVVLFVQIIPKILKVDIVKEREHFVAANSISIPEPKGKLVQLEEFGFFPFFLAVAMGCVIGAIEIPKIHFSLGNSGGTLVSGLIIGHFGRIGKLDCRISKQTLNFMRELGLVLFLIGAGVPGGVNFVSNVKFSYFIYGAIMTTVPMVAGYIIARYVFKLSIFNNLGSITGGMTSTPALGSLIAAAGTDEVSSAYAATYPLALVSIVLTAKIIVMVL